MSLKIASAQNPNIDYRCGIKIYNLGRYEESEKFRYTNPVGYNYYHDKTSTFKLLHPTIAVQWRTKKNNFHEIELTDLEWNKEDLSTYAGNDSIKTNVLVYEENIVRTSIGARYEYILMFNKKKEKRFVPSVGFAASAYYKSMRTVPGLSSAFGRSEQNMGLKMFVTPRITYFIKQKLFLDLNIPICVAQGAFTKERNEDPSMSGAQREVATLDAYTFPKMFSVRIGIGIKI